MRLFIAIELDDGLRSRLADIQSELKKSQADVKWVDPQNLHLTIKFLGSAAEDKIEKIKAALNEAVRGQKPLEAALSEIGAYPSVNAPRVIWAGADEKAKAALALITREIEGRMEKLGFPKEARPFSAHLTLGRARSPGGREKLRQIIGALNTAIADSAYASYSVNSIALFQSTLTQDGPVYNALYKIKLADM